MRAGPLVILLPKQGPSHSPETNKKFKTKAWGNELCSGRGHRHYYSLVLLAFYFLQSKGTNDAYLSWLPPWKLARFLRLATHSSTNAHPEITHLYFIQDDQSIFPIRYQQQRKLQVYQHEWTSMESQATRNVSSVLALPHASAHFFAVIKIRVGRQGKARQSKAGLPGIRWVARPNTGNFPWI